MHTMQNPDPSVSRSPSPILAGSKEQALWLLEKLVPASGVNNLSVAFRADGQLGDWELQETVYHLLDRHEALRTVFHATEIGLVKQVVRPGGLRIDVEKFQVAPERLDEELSAYVARPFTLDGQPLLRAARFQSDDGDVFCLAVHHIVFDTVSAAILLEEFTAVYDTMAAGLEPPAELSGHEAALPENPPRPESLAYWREQLGGFDPAGLGLWLGTEDIPEPTLAGGRSDHVLSEDALAAVRKLQKQLRAPEAVVLLAAYCLLLARHGAGPDIVVGSPVNVRGPQAPRAIGYHVNTLPLRVQVDFAGGFRGLVAAAREVFFGAITHADVPVDILVPEVRQEGSSWRNSVFRHLFNYVPDSGTPVFETAGLPARRLLVENGFSKFDLEFFFLASADAVKVRAMYYKEVIGESDAQLLLERFDTLLIALGADPDRAMGDVPVWGARDEAVADAANATARPVTPATLLAAVAERVTATPDAVAVEDGDRTVTYRALWRAALANRDALRAAGTERGDVVALAAGRCPELAAAALGAWLAEAAYLPLDPDHPDQRIAYLMEDSGARAVLAADGVRVPAAEGTPVLAMAPVTADPAGPAEDDPAARDAVLDALLDAAPDPDECAFLIYTSGSTGQPKGTIISHGGAANIVGHFVGEFGATPEDAVLWLTTFTFDISALELFLPLVCGGRLVVAPDAARTDGSVLLGLVERHGVTIVQATPTTWRLVVEQADGRLAGCRALSGGEPLAPALARRITDAGCELRNAYAPSETTIYSTCGTVEPGATRIDIGRPITNTQVFIADPDGRKLPVGVRGELCIAGSGVALGYRGRPELTAERFADHPEFGRHYRTGDLAAWLPDGRIELFGRVDRQVKVRGNRIELGEVEAVLLEHADVQGVGVVVAHDDSGDACLVAFVETPREEGLADRLWAHARARLPLAAVPQEFIVLDALPTTVNQKTDHLALTRLAAEKRAERAGQEGDAVPVEETGLTGTLVALWRQVLGRTDVHGGSNFFASGGHSLLGAQLVQKIEETTGEKARLADLFAHPTPVALAEYLRRQAAGTSGDAAEGTE
ncbi:amino acid adenylation domain-containing protein [Streptomyces cinnamoneus]|uniref:non-ribosomal peptide synthetase n=1 Tax=Streptomyces cinnamoneus TaxID=53446 RepID=UPI0033CC8D4C